MASAFRSGDGIPHDVYSPILWRGMERMSAAWIDGLLVSEWLPRVDGLVERLTAGADVLEIGCGNGRALAALARAFPRSRFAGIDSSPRAVAAARGNGANAEVRDARDGIDGRYDTVVLFDVLHDIAEPVGVLRSTRDALTDDGVCLVLEINAGESPADNFGPVGALLYATSLVYCVPTALADGAPAYGTLGLPPSTFAHWPRKRASRQCVMSASRIRSTSSTNCARRSVESETVVAVCVRETTATSRREMAAHVVDVMHEQLGETLALDDLAREAFLSPYHFHRVFRATTGVPPGRFLAAVRMERAKSLLLESTCGSPTSAWRSGTAASGPSRRTSAIWSASHRRVSAASRASTATFPSRRSRSGSRSRPPTGSASP